MKLGKLTVLAVMVVALWAAYTYIIFASSMRPGSPFTDTNQTRFALTGTFGDSFGGFSALMSALAFVGVVFGLQHSQDSESRQSFDSSFYTLLSHFQDVVASIDVHLQTKSAGRLPAEPPIKFAEGRDALRFLLDLLYYEIEEEYFSDSKSVYQIYSGFYDKWEDDLGHLFRIMYHLVRLIDEKCPGDKQHYSRIFRAHLSQSELRLLAYNCIVGEGREKFYKYVERYSLLHNLAPPSDSFMRAERRFFERRLDANAFRQTLPPPFQY